MERLTVGQEDMNPYDRQSRIRWLDLGAIAEAKVLMVGAGAIGNEVAKNLALSGFGRITIVDMDRIVPANLTRCVFFTPDMARNGKLKVEAVADGIRGLREDIVVETRHTEVQNLGEDFLRRFDMVIGCLDNLQTRLYLNSHAYYHRIPYIDGAMDSFRGKFQVVLPPETPCLECLTNASHARIMSLRFSCTGEDVSFHTPKVPAEITTTAVIGACLVREAVKVASGRSDLCARGVTFYDGETNRMDNYEVNVSPDCPNHDDVTVTA